MLIVILNNIKRQAITLLLVIFGLAAAFGGVLPAHAHGDGGMEFEENQMFYESFMDAFEEANGEMRQVLTDLEMQYQSGPRRAPTDEAFVEYLDERIELSAPAFAKLIDRSLDLFRARLEAADPALYRQARVFEKLNWRQKVWRIMKKYIVHQFVTVKSLITEPAEWGPKAVVLGAVALRLAIVQGLVYVGYTGITEGIESIFFGPLHWACPLFQILYVPFAFAGAQLWKPMISWGLGVGLALRLEYSLKMTKFLMSYRIGMRRLFVSVATGQSHHEFVTTRSDYKKRTAGKIHHIEEELYDKTVWQEVYRNFHLPHTRPQLQDTGDMDLRKDLDVIFHAGEGVSAARRLYIATKHIDGLNFLHNLLTNTTDGVFQNNGYSNHNYLKVTMLVASLGAHLKNYRDIVLNGAQMPRENPELLAYQRSLAEPALNAAVKMFKEARYLTTPERLDEKFHRGLADKPRELHRQLLDEWRHAEVTDKVDDIKHEFKPAKKALKYGLLLPGGFKKFKASELSKSLCASLLQGALK